MKKGAKLSDSSYTLKVNHLDHEQAFHAKGSSLRELVRMVRDFIPNMDHYSKVYRQMKENVGVYMGLFVLPVDKKRVRHAVVTISSDVVTEDDIEYFRARAAKLPRLSPELESE